MSAVLLLADLHLPPANDPMRTAFLELLAGPARQAGAVFLLGDIFEYWIGDDVGMQVYAAEIEALKGLTARGVPVFFQAGNRDFMVGRHFAEATGVRPLPDPAVVELGGEKTLLSHGDLLCSDDVGYQRWRRFSRNRVAQAIFLRLPRRRRERIAGQLRTGSDDAKQQKNGMIMDVNAETIASQFARYGVRRMLHGHTHRPARHVLEVDGQPRERIVLPDWRGGTGPLYAATWLKEDGSIEDMRWPWPAARP